MWRGVCACRLACCVRMHVVVWLRVCVYGLLPYCWLSVCRRVHTYVCVPACMGRCVLDVAFVCVVDSVCRAHPRRVYGFVLVWLLLLQLLLMLLAWLLLLLCLCVCGCGCLFVWLCVLVCAWDNVVGCLVVVSACLSGVVLYVCLSVCVCVCVLPVRRCVWVFVCV